MDSTISVSKGVFVFKNGATKASLTRRKHQKCRSLLDQTTMESFWYRSYQRLWFRVSEQIDKLQSSSYEKILDDLLAFVEGCYQSVEYNGILPTAALLTGINQIDHLSQFETLARNIKNNTFSLVVLLQSRECPSIKAAVEAIVSGYVEEHRDTDDSESKQLRRNQLNFGVLKAWYLEKHQHLDRKPNLSIIMPDFEVFSPDVLQDLILVLNSFSSELPFVLIFGVATSIANVHGVLPYHVTSKIKLSIFQSEPSVVNLNKIINNVLLTTHCPFHLSGKTFKLLVDIFLFYDFSVKGFIEGFKYALMEHYFQGNIYALCSVTNDRDELEEAVAQLDSNDLENIRQLLSFRALIESLHNPQEVIDFLTKDDYLRRLLPQMLIEVHNFWFTFNCSLEMLQVLILDLPKDPLGKQLRELYALCISTDVTQTDEFKECMQLVLLTSKDEILEKLFKMLEIINKYIEYNDEASIRGQTFFEVEPLEHMNNDLEGIATDIAQAGMNLITEDDSEKNISLTSPKMGRHELQKKLLTAARQPKFESAYTKSVNKLVIYITNDIFRKFLRPFSRGPALIELFVFNDAAAIRRHICDCCELADDCSLISTIPDLSVAYKLHLECGRMINLFDWLQAFRTVLDGSNIDEQERQVDPKIQARFTRAVAELQFLGFIKTSKKKTDHVTRLTW
ncbi:origin recognition complex subunit 3 isoform X2 [Malaya genurostris]|uniref:origin recognition complex subunit 3 isoform X2 n=1 Tax=Malaya genurostris TaxID=325434 RepID=UPI0026F3A1D6|nr:origin recognition complex subunit 3 isoform X2 [Malaya genurostris]